MTSDRKNRPLLRDIGIGEELLDELAIRDANRDDVRVQGSCIVKQLRNPHFQEDLRLSLPLVGTLSLTDFGTEKAILRISCDEIPQLFKPTKFYVTGSVFAVYDAFDGSEFKSKVDLECALNDFVLTAINFDDKKIVPGVCSLAYLTRFNRSSLGGGVSFPVISKSVKMEIEVKTSLLTQIAQSPTGCALGLKRLDVELDIHFIGMVRLLESKSK